MARMRSQSSSRWPIRHLLAAALAASVLVLGASPTAGALPSSTYDYDVGNTVVASTTTTRHATDQAPRAVSSLVGGVGFTYDSSGYLVATNTPRLRQDVAVSPNAPRPLALDRPIGRPSHNQAVQSEIAGLPEGAMDIRVNQQQVNALGQRVGINRPDLQYTLNGQRYYVEYEGLANPRGAIHQARILANDPGAVFDLRIVP